MKRNRVLLHAKRVMIALASFCLVVLGALAICQINNIVVASKDDNGLADIMPANMTNLSLSLVYTGEEVDSTINSTQSFTITDKYFIAVQAHSGNENAGWIVATSLTNPSSTPAWKKSHNVGHGNGATYNSATNRIVIVNGKTRHFFNANNGNFVEDVTTDTSATGIAYDDIANKYIQTVGSSNTSGRILDSNFNSLMTFDAGHKLVNQDVAYYKGYIYRVAWGGCSYLRNNGNEDAATYCETYFGNNSNVLYQFNMSGVFTNAFFMPAGTGELESLAFGPDGTPYLMINGKPDSTHYSVYKVTNSAALNKMGAAPYKVTFSANGGTSAPSTISKTAGQSVTIPTTQPTRTHYTFKGWSTSSNATSADSNYAPGATINGLETDLKLYAVWNENTYTITYNANGGTGAPAAQNFKVSNNPTTLSSTKPTRTNYQFLGWSTSANATSASYAAGANVSFAANTTLYAVWSENTYTITYNANGGTGAPAAQNFTPSNNSVTISTTKPTRANYAFVGWSTSNTATSANYEAGKTYTFTSNTTLYAVWAPIYFLTFNANNGTGAPANQTCTAVSGLTIKASCTITISSSKPQRQYYTFLGWADSSSATAKQYDAGGTITISKNATIYAVWNENTYTITYNANGGTGAPAAQSYKVSDGAKISSTKPTRQYYSFLGWNTSSTATSADPKYNPGAAITTGENITLYAVWGENSRRLTFDPNGGTVETKYIDEKIYTCIDYSDIRATREGWTFGAWLSEISIEGLGSNNAEQKYCGYTDATLHAAWLKEIHISIDNQNGDEIKKYDTIYFEDITDELVEAARNGEELSDTMKEFVGAYMKSGILLSELDEPVRDGFIFLGYSTTPNALTAEYPKGYNEPIRESLTLYAVWQVAPKNPLTKDGVLPAIVITFGAISAGGIITTAFRRRH